nr:G protein-coupled receptor [Proales similis]
MSTNSTDVNSTESNSSNWRQFDYEMIAPSFGYLIILIFGSFGTLSQLGNGMTIASTLWFDSLRRNPTYLVIMNQAIADLLICLIVPTRWIVVLFVGGQFLIDNQLLCHVVAISNVVLPIVTLLSMSLLAINRYMSIIHSQRYKHWFTINKTVAYCIAVWAASFLLEAFNYTEVGGRVYDRKIRSCFYDRTKILYMMILSIGCVGLPCLIISSSYLKIYFFVRKRKRSVQQQQQSQSKAQKDSLALAKSLFVIFFVYCVCWLPVGTVFIIDPLFNLPYWMFIYTGLLVYFNSAINPLIYALTNPTFSEAYMFCVKKLSCSLVFNNFEPKRLEGRRDQTTQY